RTRRYLDRTGLGRVCPTLRKIWMNSARFPSRPVRERKSSAVQPYRFGRNRRLFVGEQVTEFVSLGLQICFGMNARRHFTRYTLNNRDSCAFERRNFVRIVRKQSHPIDSK